MSQHQLQTIYVTNKHPLLTARPPLPADQRTTLGRPVYCRHTSGKLYKKGPNPQCPTKLLTEPLPGAMCGLSSHQNLQNWANSRWGECKVGATEGHLGAHTPSLETQPLTCHEQTMPVTLLKSFLMNLRYFKVSWGVTLGLKESHRCPHSSAPLPASPFHPNSQGRGAEAPEQSRWKIPQGVSSHHEIYTQ